MVKFKVAYFKSVPEFKSGKVISRGYWKGCDYIRQTKNKTYLVVFGSKMYGSAPGCCDHVFEILEAPKGYDISGLSLLEEPCEYQRGYVGIACFVTSEEWNEYMNLQTF